MSDTDFPEMMDPWQVVEGHQLLLLLITLEIRA